MKTPAESSRNLISLIQGQLQLCSPTVAAYTGKQTLILIVVLVLSRKTLVVFNSIPGRSRKGAEGGAHGASRQQGRHGAPETSQLRRR